MEWFIVSEINHVRINFQSIAFYRNTLKEFRGKFCKDSNTELFKRSLVLYRTTEEWSWYSISDFFAFKNCYMLEHEDINTREEKRIK